MNARFASLLFALGLTSAAHATVTLVFSQPYAGGIASNFANASSTARDNMRWGIVVDTGNNGFSNSGTSYDAYLAGVTTAGFFSANGSTTDDYFIPGGLTADSSAYQEGDNSTFGAHGTIYNTSAIPLASASDPGGVVSSGQKFALVWFSTDSSAAGDKYGFFTDATFTLPVNTTTGGGYDAVFTGTDPIRSATSTFASLAPVPEPSRALLLAVGALGVAGRRRRKTV